jgi:hypothetical protein
MKVIKSNTVTPTTLTATDVPENDASEWVTSTNYHVGDQAMVTTTANGAATATHKIYLALTDSKCLTMLYKSKQLKLMLLM